MNERTHARICRLNYGRTFVRLDSLCVARASSRRGGVLIIIVRIYVYVRVCVCVRVRSIWGAARARATRERAQCS